MMFLRNVRCPECNKLICKIRVKGYARLECVCSRCGIEFTAKYNSLNKRR